MEHRPFGRDLGFFSQQPLASFTFADRFTPGTLVRRVSVSLFESAQFVAK